MRHIDELKKACEKVMGKTMASPANFNELSLRIKKSTGKSISVSTLKRIWGYVNSPHKTSNEILSILSSFAGYRDWHDFRNADAVTDSSDFIGEDIIKSSDLPIGTHVQIGWKPDRRCILEYMGTSDFKVVEADNCKLQAGDVFSCGVIAQGEPMICHNVRRGGNLLAEGYVAGKTGGIISLQILLEVPLGSH